MSRGTVIIQNSKQNNIYQLSAKLRDILDDLLATGDWSSSLFLRTVAANIRGIRDKSDQLYRKSSINLSVKQELQNNRRKVPPIGYTQVFILLYQLDGANLPGWYQTIKTLGDYSITRPIYKNEDNVKEIIRSKTANMDRNGYVVVNVKNDDLLPSEQVDQFGHSLCALKDSAIKNENIIEFIHDNKKRYSYGSNELIYLGEI